ncbi:class I SAM-dependent methyltransferase [Mycobacterium sp. CBMA293]|nr:class I SAM-dependent methyltransferase [Mycolicibacterium sp. CBMA 360]MUL58539.1 class I SAM-dependent methyltransferase [Mycolicibacterium sp. CBMA 335]MUL73997.1 class I SAM-dependent methyltransferase [Mycolicibacterium sp. CBMA 311]MUL93422.1 class I SAM-dependent methyltransferase [Mycolicibacterium sp. CBMA 230]MUM04637.1 SAM-dependent methyltransferase [Mycolicibacterium sp. CBMA 213]MUM10265.1 class I SAM-dependent methyltransferase [Mycolicibacterium sp. CBMA 293]MUM32177.1 clas
MVIYDVIGATYAQTRRADPRIAAAIETALGDVTSVVNIGAGAGSYEPANTVVAVEPSHVMIRQRQPGAAPAVQAVAEALPLRDKSVDAALAVLTVHHWTDVSAGIWEMQRVARRRLVFFTWRPEVIAQFWLLRDYLPAAAAADAEVAVPLETLAAAVPGSEMHVASVPVPHDCTDGFGAAYWRHPHAYLDPEVRAGISMLARTDPSVLAPGLRRLKDDLASERWQRTYAELLDHDVLDVGYCTVTIDL